MDGSCTRREREPKGGAMLLPTANQEGDPAVLQCRVLGDGVWYCSGDAIEEGCREEKGPWAAVCCAQGDIGGWSCEGRD